MKRYILLVLVVMLALVLVPVAAQDETPRQGIRPDAPPYAIRGPYAVGTMELVIEPDSDRPLVTTAWYPAVMPENMGGMEPEILYVLFPAMPDFTAAGNAILDAEQDASGGPYPLIVLSHGSPGSRFVMPYLGEHLASHGFVVLAIDHVGDTMMEGRDKVYETLYYRPHDISRTIDAAVELTAAGGLFAGMIDTEHVGVTGLSMGGFTSLMAGGAHINMDGFDADCAARSEASELCLQLHDHLEDMANMAGLDAPPETDWPSWGDPRVDAVAPIAPGPGVVAGSGARTVAVPTLLILGSNDTMVPTQAVGYPIWENLGTDSKTLAEFINGGHTFGALSCASSPVLANMAWPWCSDLVWDMNRAHDLVDYFVTAFFLSQLKGDTDAAAALAPDAVNFVGIHYETTGY